MAKKKPKPFPPSVADHPKLHAWLEMHNATCVWIVEGIGLMAPTVQGWRVGSGIVVVLLSPGAPARQATWSIATELDSVNIDDIFKDAEARLGINQEASS